MNTTVGALCSIAIILILGALLALAGSAGSSVVWGWPLFALCGFFSFGINWVVFIPSFIAQTEHYFDLTGSLTYLGLLVFVLALGESVDARSILLAIMVGLWAVRLGSFLFRRVREDGSDGRFDAIKPNFARFLMAFTLQGLWVFLTLSCALAAMTSSQVAPLGGFAFLGALLFVLGFAVEVTADRQKRAFRADPANGDRFITTGLWARSQHPNYAGEITLWIGVAFVAFPVLSGWQYVTLISPVFVFVLLTRISGIPLLEARGERKWGDDPAYREYRERTPMLFPYGR